MRPKASNEIKKELPSIFIAGLKRRASQENEKLEIMNGADTTPLIPNMRLTPFRDAIKGEWLSMTLARQFSSFD